MSIVRNAAYVFRVGQLGDALVALPALYALQHAMNHAPLILITDNFAGRGSVPAEQVFQLTGLFIDRLTYVPFVDSKVRGLRSLASLSRRIRQTGGHKVFLLVDPGRSAAQMRRFRFFFGTLCGLDVIGANEASSSYHPRNLDGRLREEIPEYQRLRQIILDHFGQERCGEICFHLPINGSHGAKVESLWKVVPASCDSVPVAFGPGSKMQSKRWREDRFIQLGLQLIENYKVLPVVFGGVEDAELGDRLKAAWGTGLNLAAKLSVAEAAAAMSRCTFYIGNDTGTMHLAAVAGLPCVCLFSARDNPGRWNPVNSGHEILRARISCEGCSAISCPQGEPKCMDLITIDEAYAAAERMLRRLR